MIRERFCSFIVNFSYYISFLVGIPPAPLNLKKQKFRDSRLYLCYSAFTHFFSIFANIFGGFYYFHAGFMTDNSVLMWTYMISNCTKILFLLVLVKELWLKRKIIMKVYNDFCALNRRHKAFLNECQYEQVKSETVCAADRLGAEGGRSADAKDCESREVYQMRHQSLEFRIMNLIIFKFILTYSCVLMTSYNFLTMHPGTDSIYRPITYISFILNAFLLSVSEHFFYVLSQLYRHFSQINFQLHSLSMQCQQKGSRRITVETSACRMNSLALLHFETYHLTQRIFSIVELTWAVFLLRVFFVNMRTVYSACLLLSQHHTEGLLALTHDLLLTVCYFADSAMVMGMLDAVMVECNDTGQVLKEYAGLRDNHEADGFGRALDSFAARLSCHKLRYKVCGLFEFNKEAALQFFLMVLVKVTVLVQFDMENKLIQSAKLEESNLWMK